MADSSSNPPRPRPRPRPIVRHVDSATSSSTLGASSPSTSTIPIAPSGKPLVIEVHDTDEMFMRNKNRTFQTWQKLDQINKDVVKPNEATSSDSDDGTTPKKHKRQKKKSNAAPVWPNNSKFTRLLSQDISDDSEIEVLGESSTPKGKRKRKQRSRSRSITPPPALPEHQIQNAKNVVRRALGASARAPSPTFMDRDETAEDITFQPELNIIAQEIAEHSHRGGSQAPVDGEHEHLVLTVRWHPHPLDPNGHEEKWEYKIDRNDSFRDLFEATADDANILSSSLIMTYQGKRFFPSVTPTILKIWTDTAELAAYEKRTYEYIQNELHTGAPAPSIPKQDGNVVEIDSDGGEAEIDPYVTQSQPQESEADSEAEGETFKLILRSSGNKDITLTVRPTTKCGAIVKAFLKKHGLVEQYPHLFADTPAKTAKKGKKGKANVVEKNPQLYIDGDKMDNQGPIGDMDLEDGDMVEVVGL